MSRRHVQGAAPFDAATLPPCLADAPRDSSQHKTPTTQEQKAILQEQKAILHGQKAILQEQKAILHGQKAILHGQKAILHGQKAILHVWAHLVDSAEPVTCANARRRKCDSTAGV